ncbi:SPbeta prophage-derived uncharacterized transglycosylase YomI-like [Synchiropus splendidus]|uniref:SPbeta prophage-derived uncharacterized transglycosylase YomI-like n=1 Tax=Synchiropus splendidus TaxID=270530 RepID=UPI00237D5EB4|nr:SPbeta prophage-derived uncharacterized transglycosylase YomI-like [Synchiropus splendidus]XP_053733881.1 SPbeta prophage-derived uncharacterized transglycosylase YomI-like [Synchiropus splendidus]
MEEQFSIGTVQSLLLKLALENQELSLKKSDVNQQIKICKAAIAKRQLSIEATQSNIQRLDSEVQSRQNTVKHSRDTLEGLKETNKHLRHYEHTLKAELENTKTNFDRDKALYEERINNYRETFQKQKNYFCQSPLAQKLIQLQGEMEDIETRIKSHDEKIDARQQELDRLTAASASTEKPVDSDQHLKHEGTQLDTSTSEEAPLHLSQQQEEEPNEEDVPEEKELQEEAGAPDIGNDGFVCADEWKDQSDEIHAEEHVQETEPFIQEKMEVIPQEEEETEKETGREVSAEMDTTEDHAALPQKQLEENPFDSQPAAVAPAFMFDFGSRDSPCASDAKSPASFFSAHSEPSGSVCTDFGFNVDSPPEDCFAFANSFFVEKKSSDSKPGGSDFLFNQSMQNEDFQFPFDANSPDTGEMDSSKDEFPFNF